LSIAKGGAVGAFMRSLSGRRAAGVNLDTRRASFIAGLHLGA
jgi:hypothetical protein